MTQVSVIRDVWDPLGLHLNQKRSKIGLEMAEYYQLAKERLREAVGH